RYDAMGNRLSEQVDNRITSGSFNELNQLVSQQPTGPVRVLAQASEPMTGGISLGNAHGPLATDGSGRIDAYTSGSATPGTSATLLLEGMDASDNYTALYRQVMTEGGVKREFTYDENGNTTS